jgi:hypothetical protein
MQPKNVFFNNAAWGIASVLASGFPQHAPTGGDAARVQTCRPYFQKRSPVEMCIWLNNLQVRRCKAR